MPVRTSSRLPIGALRATLTAAALACAALTAGCAATADEVDEDTESVGDLEDGVSGGTVAQAISNSCGTASVKGLSKQIIAEAACMNAEAYVAVPDLGNVSFGSGVFAYLEKPAKEKLVKALKSKSGTQMTVNSMLRTVAQQYLLYRWYQLGTCGIGLAAKPGNSNHETGLALDISQYSTWKGTLQANGFAWLGSSDPVHFDYAGAGAKSYKGLDVKAFQRLWNRNNPGDKIDADGIWGPQTEARMKKSPAGGFAKGATCSSPQSQDVDAELTAMDEESMFGDQDHILAISEGIEDSLDDAAAADTCSTCFTAICDADAYCCETDWDERCVEQGTQICESLCGAEAMAPL